MDSSGLSSFNVVYSSHIWTLNHAHVVKRLGLSTFVSIEEKKGGMSCTAYVLLKLCPEME